MPSAFVPLSRFLFSLASLVVISLAADGAAVAAEQKISYSREIRPILSENCFYCHGQDANKRKADLRLDVKESAYRAAESGEIAIVPGQPEASALVERIFSSDAEEQMPPPKAHRTLSAEQKAKLKAWIAQGAEYEPHWAYVAPVRPATPQVKREEWVKNGIDALVLARLEGEELEPAPEADRATLIRRVSLDLIGLPPTPAEVDAYVGDTAPDAYERLVDRLLASPHYGERMALPWLDAARYADSNGFQQEGDTFQWIWRDWVVRALNADLPFDRFSIEQLAGDLLPNPTQDQLIATAFNRNHLLNGEGGAIPEEQRYNNLFDRVDNTATTWLGLTVACAQCHDHKFDPITQRDYYGLLQMFNQVSESGLAGGSATRMRMAPPLLDAPTDATKKRVAELKSAVQSAANAGGGPGKLELAFSAWRAAVAPETSTPEGKPLEGKLIALLKMEPGKRSEAEKTELEKGLRGVFESKVWPEIAKKDEGASSWEGARTALTRYRNEETPRVMIMRDDRPRDTFILERGNYLKPKEKVGFSTPAFLPAPAVDAPQNRLGFARWLFQPEHPLTARVQVNRMWQLFFGAALVKTVEDLGVQSELPEHQDVLDWLAVEFRESGWSMKHMHRLIVTSATYRQSSRVSPEQLHRDPENKLLARGARFRASSLILRDVALSASGLLNPALGGEPVYPYQPEGIWETLAITKERDFTYPASKGADLYRRSLYTFWRRTIGPANMFDASTRQTCKVRSSTTSTPLHALTTLNDPTWAEAARVLAAHSLQTASQPDEQIGFAFRRVLGRAPGEKEMGMLRQALARQRAIFEQDPAAAAAVVKVGEAPAAENLPVAEHAALSAVCLALFNLDEALTHE